MTQVNGQLRIAVIEKRLHDAENALYQARKIFRQLMDETGADCFAATPKKAETQPDSDYLKAPEEGCSE